MFFLFLQENICCGYSLEAPHRGTSNEYPQHMFLWRNKKISSTGKSALSEVLHSFVEKMIKIISSQKQVA